MLGASLLQPNDWRVQLSQIGALDILGYCSYVLGGNTAQVPAQPSQFGFPTGSGNTTVFTHDGSGNAYFYHPNYLPAQAQQGTIDSLGLEPGAMKVIETRIRADINSRGGNADKVLSEKPLGSWLLFGIGAAVLAAGIVITVLGFAGMPFTFGASMFMAGVLGPMLIKVGLVITFAGLAYALFYPDITNQFTTSNGSHCWTSTNILGSTTTCVDPNGNINTQTTSPGFGGFLIPLAEGVAALVVVGIGGYVIYKVVQKHYNNPSSPSVPLRQRLGFGPPRAPAYPV